MSQHLHREFPEYKFKGLSQNVMERGDNYAGRIGRKERIFDNYAGIIVRKARSDDNYAGGIGRKARSYGNYTGAPQIRKIQ
jgi:hypothetical protein